MKNVVKMLGIIAMLAIVGFAVSCSTDAEDQTIITITGFTSKADNVYGYIILSKEKAVSADSQVAFGQAKQISGGTLTNEMNDDSGGIYGDDKDLFIYLGIGNSAAAAEDNARKDPLFISDSKKAVKKGDNSFPTSIFSPDPKDYFGAEDDAKARIGNYSCNYKSSGGEDRIESVDMTLTSFKIYDSTDTLEFNISEGWLYSAVPSSDYSVGFKFTGVIKSAKYYAASGSDPEALYGTKTAPNFNSNDLNKTEAWMYLYFKSDGTFVRTAFSKEGFDQAGKIITGGNDSPRVYTKK